MAFFAAANAGAGIQLLYGFGWQLCLPLLVYVGGKLLIDEKLSPGAFMSFYGLTLMLVFVGVGLSAIARQPLGHLSLAIVALGFVALGIHSFICTAWIRMPR